MIYSDVGKWARFATLRGKYLLLRKVGNVLVAMHVRTTPRSATTDTLTEIIQEQLRAAQRRVEFRCHTLQQQYTELGKEILHDHDATTQSQTAEDATQAKDTNAGAPN